jgi:hypothetical protein
VNDENSHKSATQILSDLYPDPKSLPAPAATMGNSTLPTVCDKLNLIASVHNRKLTAAMARELKEKDMKLKQLSDKIIELENTAKIIMDKMKSETDGLN